jgi:replicative DNA helicase
VEAEEAVLGAAIMDTKALGRAVNGLSDEDFFSEPHQHIFQGLAAAHRAGVLPDFTFLQEHFKTKGLDADGKILRVFAEIADKVSTAAGIDYHLQVVKEYSIRRKVIRLATDAQARVLTGDPAEVLRDLQSDLEGLEGPGIGEGKEARRKPLRIDELEVSRFLDHEPEPIRYIFQDLLPAGIVAEIAAAGGTGKSFLVLGLAMSAASGEPIFHKAFRPSRPHLVLCLVAEDPEEILHSRLYCIFERLVPGDQPDLQDIIRRNFCVASVVGRVGPLMRLQDGNPVKSDWWTWLFRTIEALGGVDLLILDPKSRLYGLDENNNDHATAWISCLEELNRIFGCTTLFTHHVSKKSNENKDIIADSSRGGGALTDGARWVAGARELKEETAKRFDVEARQFIEFDIPKYNYGPRLPAQLYFKRSDHGVLVPANLEFGRLREKALEFCDLLESQLKEGGDTFTRRELKQTLGAGLRGLLGCTVREMGDVVDFALREGWINTEPTGVGRNQREVLTPTIAARK